MKEDIVLGNYHDLKQQIGRLLEQGRSNLFYMRKLYLTSPKSETLSHKLSWSHYMKILKVDPELKSSIK